MDFNSEELMALAQDYGIRLIQAIVVVVIGMWIAKAITKAVKKTMQKREVDPSLQPFLGGLIGTLLKVMVYITAISMLGVEMTSFVAILGAAGFAIGMALSGTLSNFAGGVMILIFKPFRVGDFIDAQGHMGTVNEIQIFNTILKTPDNKTIIIPNGGLSTGSMTNFSTEKLRRVDMTFGIGYGDSISKAKEVMMELIETDNRILKDPAPFVRVSELGDSSVNFAVRLWCSGADYWDVYFDMNEKVYETFAERGLNIPYPQMDVHVHNAK
jgi:small conductance mechanosensitive channel